MQNNELPVKEKVKRSIETYNKYATIYAQYTKEKLLQFQLEKFISLLFSKGKILDAGCGCGRDSLYLIENGLNVIAVDLSEGMIKEAKKNEVNAIKGDLLLMKSNKEFAGIWCMATLHSIPKTDAPKLMKNFYSALEKEGILYIAVKEGEGEHLIEKKRYENSPIFYAFYKKEELEDLLKSCNFEIIELIISDDEGTNWIEVFAKKI